MIVNSLQMLWHTCISQNYRYCMQTTITTKGVLTPPIETRAMNLTIATYWWLISSNLCVHELMIIFCNDVITSETTLDWLYPYNLRPTHFWHLTSMASVAAGTRMIELELPVMVPLRVVYFVYSPPACIAQVWIDAEMLEWRPWAATYV